MSLGKRGQYARTLQLYGAFCWCLVIEVGHERASLNAWLVVVARTCGLLRN